MLGTTNGRERIERAANAVEKAASKARSRLRLALAICAASGKGGNALQSQHWTAATRACAPFENAIEREFFPILEATALAAEDASSAAAADALDTAIGEIAEKVLETGLQRLAPSGWRRDQARTAALRAYRRKTEPTTPGNRNGNGNGNDTSGDGSEQGARAAQSGARSPETPAADKPTKRAPDPVGDAARELLHSIQLLSKAEQHRLDRIPLDGGSGSAGHPVEEDPIVTRLREAHAKAMPDTDALTWTGLIQAALAGIRPKRRTTARTPAAKPLGAALQLARVSDGTLHQLVRSEGKRRVIETVRACRRMKAMRTPPAAIDDICRFIGGRDVENDARIAESFYSRHHRR